MAKRAVKTTEDYLINASLPEATETYTVIPHGAIINKVRSALAAKGLVIERELYRCNDGAQVAQGVYHLKYGTDPDLGMLFAWSNSYDKSMRFMCSSGAFVHKSLASIIGGNMGTFGRKHTGTADQEVFETIDEQIENADAYFAELIADKEIMKNISVSEEARAEFMGRIYFVNELVTGEHLSMIKQEFNKPSFEYDGVQNSLWAMYNSIIYVLQRAHPRTWMTQQRMVHYLLCNHFNVKAGIVAVAEQNSSTPELDHEVDPKQTSLLEEFAKVETHDFVEVMDNTPVLEISGGNVNDLFVAEDDSDWQCLKCGEMQKADAVFYDGQLCVNCVEK